MELYKERQINPLASLGLVLLQAPILIGLFFALQKITKDSHAILDYSYSFLHHLSWLQTLSVDISQFEHTLFGAIDLTRTALSSSGVYWPALLLGLVSAMAQFFQSRQLMPKDKDARGLRSILKDAGKGQSADQQEVGAAVGRSMLYVIPIFVFLVSLHLAAALPLFWLTSSLVAIWQQGRVLKQDVSEATAVADSPKRSTGGARVVSVKTLPSATKSRGGSKKKGGGKKKR
jgi:membrane protein insertase Oxa1/YidC/SpoIIIJ